MVRAWLPALLAVFSGSVLAFFWWLMFGIVAQYRHGQTDLDFLQTKQHIIHAAHYRWAFYLHISSSLLILAAGLTQFSAYLLRKKAGLHRWIGRIYTAFILLLSGPSGLVMAFYANGGSLAKASFITLSIAWWASTWVAWRMIRNGRPVEHGAWMIRSYALTLSAITLRILQYGFATLTDLDMETSYRMVAWPSWLLNWMIAEWLIAYWQWPRRILRGKT